MRRPDPNRLLLADQDPTGQRELRDLLGGSGFVVVGQAADRSSVIRLARELKPSLTLIDLSMPDGSGVEATQAIVDEDPNARILILARSDDDEREVLDALVAGACGYLFKDLQDEDEIVAAVQAAVEGDTIVSPAMVMRLIGELREQRRRERVQAPPKPPPLTSRQLDVLRLIAQGRENSAIATELSISPSMVKLHVAHLLKTLGLKNRVQAAVFAVRHRIV
jgi:DNA-binding NarL/FixJ family response regulator